MGRIQLLVSRVAVTIGLLASAGAAEAADYMFSVLTAGPIAYFRLNGADQPSLVGGYTTSYANGVGSGPGAPIVADPTNTAAAFDGVNDASPGIVTTSLSGGVGGRGSLIAWVNLASLPSTTGEIRYVAGESQSGNDLDLQFQGDNRLYFYTGGGENTSFAPNAASLVGQWHMIVATFDGTDTGGDFRNIYWDGALAASFTGDVNGAAKVNPFTIGYSPVFGGREFDGRIDEVALFDRALSAGEIASLYAARLEPAAVPEPATWAMLIGGFGLVGASLRRRCVSGRASA